MTPGPATDAPYDATAAACATTRRRATDRGGSETRIAAEIDRTLAASSSAIYMINTHGDSMSHGGTPDRLGVADGRALAIEIKRPGEHPGRRQMIELRRWQAAGALAGWAESAEHVEALLARLHDRSWTNPLTGPGDPTLGDAADVGSAREPAPPPAGGR